MPRVKLARLLQKPPIKVDHTRALLKEAKQKRGLTWAQIAPLVGLEPSTLPVKISKGATGLTCGFSVLCRRRWTFRRRS